MATLKVVIADDHRLMLEGIRAALSTADDIEIVGEASSGAQVLPLVACNDPDLVLLDVHMPHPDGLACLELIRKRHPHVKVVMLSGLDEPQVIQAALRRGASAFVLKHVDPRDLSSALRQVAHGSVYQTFGQPEEGATPARTSGLTERELTILTALGRGLSNKQIGREAWVGEQTVKFHLRNIYRKLDVANRTEAARYAYRHGLVVDPAYDAA